MDMGALEERSYRLWYDVDIRPVHQGIMLSFLDRLKQHAPSMYAHSLRVGIYSSRLAEQDSPSNRRLAVMGGCMHDIGKCGCRTELLSGRDITLAEYEEIKAHAYEGFLMLKDHLVLTAMIAGLHHWKDGRGYGATLDNLPFPLHLRTRETLVEAVKRVSISDYFDAVQTRGNSKFGLDRENREQVAAAIAAEYRLAPLQASSLVGTLYDNKILWQPDSGNA
jgi:response regulator RpfG family c-di-GMP phosphodiesterase